MVAVIRIKKSSPKHFNAVTDILSGMGNNEVKGRKSSIKTENQQVNNVQLSLETVKLSLLIIMSNLQSCDQLAKCLKIAVFWFLIGII